MLVSELSARDEKIYHEVQEDLHCMVHMGFHMGLYKDCINRKLVKKEEICEKTTDSYENDLRVKENMSSEEYKCYLAHEQNLKRWKNEY